MNLLQLFSRLLTKVILHEESYFRRKLMLSPVTYGPGERVHLGKGVNLQNVTLNTNSGHIYIDDYSFFGHDCMVLTGTHVAAKTGMARINDHPTEGNDIRIGKGVWISSRAMILGGVQVADNSVIAAGSIVTKSCLEPGIYAGVPACKIADLPIGLQVAAKS